ncbi:MAG: hypothetical protein JOZ78_00405 [Chroococcidiopsidaceae cyanobacterium CP_BM_ER_R8_30]|nr:hypothetical protein [Chroococcidiopsidaceae cyanobacterium CP_BM_ER_R8_30]
MLQSSWSSGKANIIYSSSLLRQIWLPSECQDVSIDFWVGHVVMHNNQLYTCTENLYLLPGKSSYSSNQPRLVKTRGNQQPDEDKQQQIAIRKINWAALRKNCRGYTTVMKLDRCSLRCLSQEAFVSLQEDTREAILLLKDELCD